MAHQAPRQGVDAFFNGNYDVSSGYVIPDVKDLEFGKREENWNWLMEPPPLTYEAGPSGLVVLLRGANIDYLY
jgi:hypothetical protein